jgi:hypothetical protein
MASITLLDTYGFHRSTVFGFEIEGKPMILGCTARTNAKKEIDFKAQKVNSGKLLVTLYAPAETRKDGAGIWWEGEVLMALWPDTNFKERLTDTGWIRWRAEHLIGSSITGVTMQEEAIRAKYKDAQRIRFEE